MRDPISTYNMVIGAAALAVQRLGRVCSKVGRCIEVATWLYPEDVSKAAPSFARATDMVEFFANRIGPFPYSKLGHVQSATRTRGMENATAIFYPEKEIADGLDIEVTVAHETAHHWFGNAVTQADWHHLRLSEGFATYFTELFFEHADGAERLRSGMENHRNVILRSAVAIQRPIIHPAEQN